MRLFLKIASLSLLVALAGCGQHDDDDLEIQTMFLKQPQSFDWQSSSFDQRTQAKKQN